jgi:hypothetical protein
MPASPVLASVTGNWFVALVDWSIYPDPADSFNIYYKKSADPTWALHHNHSGQGQAANMSACPGLQQLTSYDFRVTAIHQSVESDPSNVLSLTTTAKPNLD